MARSTFIYMLYRPGYPGIIGAWTTKSDFLGHLKAYTPRFLEELVVERWRDGELAQGFSTRPALEWVRDG